MTQQSEILAISFSAYNRGDVLLNNLRIMLPEISRHNIAVYISDDSTDDATLRAVEELKKTYPLFHYKKNQTRLGHDGNILAALNLPDSRYVWYLGDSMIFKEGTLDAILSALSDEPDLVFINSHGQRAFYREGSVDNAKSFLLKMSWHLTLTGATIYGRRCLDLMLSLNNYKDKYPNFLQLGLIFEFLALVQGSIIWVQQGEINPYRGKTTYWRGNAVEVFAVDWAHAIESAPIFDQSDKPTIIRSHSVRTGIFGLQNLFAMRADGAFSRTIFRENYREIQLAFRTPMWIAWIIAIVPQDLAVFLVERLKRLRNTLRIKQKPTD